MQVLIPQLQPRLHDISLRSALDLICPIGYIAAMSDERKSRAADDRDARLAEALRANLKRRKAQARRRVAPCDEADPGKDLPPENDDKT